MQQAAETPCIGVCSTAIGDDVCQGCARTFAEISCWYELDASTKARVWAALPRRRVWQALAKVAGGHLQISDGAAGEQALLQLADGRLLQMALPQQQAGARYVPLQLDGRQLALTVSDSAWPQQLQQFLSSAPAG
ncbi:DUF1289 domain-containing protein [Vogesella facilis]|uniref:DUF1289 domain-containing protein n=1 Tax=Vogesella facilis TaxID=1655232 RepID=A0ABV7RI97_9NEIS